MKQAKKIFLILLLVVAMSISAVSGVLAAAKKETFRIGMTAAITGAFAPLGEGMKNALNLAKEHLRKDTKYNYEIFIEDDQLNPKITATVANKLVNINKVDALITIESNPGHVAANIAKEHGIFQFGISAMANVANGTTSFIHWTPALSQAKVVVRELKKHGYKRVAVFKSTTIEDWGAYSDNVCKLLESEKGMSCVTTQAFLDDQKDFRTYIAKAKEANPDIYFFVVATPAIEMLTKQLRESGDNRPITSIEAFEGTEQPELFNGLWYVSAGEPTLAYRKAYEDKYHILPYLCSANVYDIFNMIVTAIENVKSSKRPTTPEIVAELHKLNAFPGTLGTLNILPNGVTDSLPQVKMMKDGKVVPIGN